jgi:lipopolysaccharide assembly protein A
MRLLVWLVRAVIFFVLFAFALNNQHNASIHWFFEQQWRAPMVFIVLAAFALGCAFGVFAMVPSWWQHRRVARRHAVTGASVDVAPAALPAEVALQHPPRDGL